jgi:2-Cys peroxiredoxin 5
MAPKKAPKKDAKPPKKIYDFSGLEKGMKCQAESDGAWYAAEILQVSESKNRAKAPVKVSWKGYDGYDSWVSGERLRSKALKVTIEKPPPKEKKPPKVIKVGDKIPAITIDEGFNPIGKVDMAEACKGKKIVILGLPGAFTPC